MPLSHAIFVAFATAASVLCHGATASPDDAIPEQWRKSIPQVWDHTIARSYLGMGLNISATNNWAMDQIMDGQGTINVCLRWGANTTLTQQNREHFEDVYKKSFQSWLKWLPGWDNFPFETISVKIVGWAVSNATLVEGSTAAYEVYTGFEDDRGRPTCNPGCSRELHQDGNYSECPGGSENRFHQFMLLDPSWGDFNMGAASSPGVELSMYGWETIGSQGKDWPMPVHELGHTFGFPDFLTDFTRPENRTICSMLWLPENAPEKFVMMPGGGGFDMPPALTEMEGWLLRHWWSRFSRLRGWQKDNVTWPTPPLCTAMGLRAVTSFGGVDSICSLH